jgi:WD40 repeat protein
VIWLQFALQAKQLATVTESMQVELWEARSGARRMSSRLPEPLGGPLCLSPDGIYLAIGGNTLAIYDLSNSCCVARLRPYKTTVDALAFSPDGTQLASCSQDGVATVWRAGTWQEQAVLRGHLLGVHSVAFSGDGRRLATGSVGKEAVKLWDLSTMQEVLNIPGDGQIIFWLGFAPDGRSLLGLGSTSGLKCWAAAGE